MNHERVKTILGEILGVTAAEIPEDASWETYPLWTSLAHLELMMALESEYQLGLQTEDIMKLNSLASIRDYLLAQGK